MTVFFSRENSSSQAQATLSFRIMLTEPLTHFDQIPDALTNHYLKISGIREPDIRATRLVSLAAQRFISQVSADARACAQQRFEMQAKDKRERGLDPRDRRVVLTIDDLHAALNDYGLDLRKPEYFAGGVTDGSRG